LSDSPTTEAALVERAGRLAGFSHPAFPAVRRIERVQAPSGGLVIVADAVGGVRLSDVLRGAERRWAEPNHDAAVEVVRQVTAAIAALHRHSRDLAHGAIGPERIVLGPDGRSSVVDGVLGPALEGLQKGRTPLWTQFRVPVPSVAGFARFDQLTDVMQIGVLALALVSGRLLGRDEFPRSLLDLLAQASTADPLTARPVLSRSMRSWITRTFQLEPRSSFRTAIEAESALTEILGREPGCRPSPAAVRQYLEACLPESNAAPTPAEDDGRAGAPPRDGRRGESASETARQAERFATVRIFNATVPHPKPTASRTVAMLPAAAPAASSALDRRATRAVRTGAVSLDALQSVFRWMAGQMSWLNWMSVRAALRVAVVACGLMALFGVTYLGARGYLGLSGIAGGTGTLVVESRPSGASLIVDGFAKGATPATLQLSAGDHTIALHTSRGTTLVPVTVVAGTRKVERVEIRQRGRSPKSGLTPALPAARLQQ
jgi:hypothetical protein